MAIWASLVSMTGGDSGWIELICATTMSPVHVLAWRGLAWGQGNTRVTAVTVLASLAGGLHVGTMQDFIAAPKWPWQAECVWELPACELLSVAAVLDLAPPEWTSTQKSIALVVATLLPVFPLSPRIDSAGGTPGRQRATSHGPLGRAKSRTPHRTSQPMEVDSDVEAAGVRGHPRSLAGAFRHAGT